MIVTGEAQRQAWRARRLPPVEEVAAGLWSVPVTIPASPLRYTLAYLIHSDDSVIAVDLGWDSDAGWQDLLAGLAAAGISPDRVTGVVATHVHPDHHGLSADHRFMRRAALAETAAHIAYLEEAGGLVTRAAGAPGGDRFWIAAPATIGRNG